MIGLDSFPDWLVDLYHVEDGLVLAPRFSCELEYDLFLAVVHGLQK